MPDLASALRRLSTALALTVFAAAAAASPAGASTYGEITHFGSAGSGAGQLEPSLEAAGIGVDPTDNSVYTVDLPDEKGEFRIQKFTESGGKYSAVASEKFKPKDPTGKEEPDSVEGVAVDPALKRVYVLASVLRGPPTEKKVDPEVEAASQLYAFSTEPSDGKLVPIAGPEEQALAGSKVLNPTSNVQGVALLEPQGITVDPTTHDVIIMGYEDTGAAESEPLIALERVSEKGTLGARWIDSTDFFEGEGGDSPAVTKNGTVLVDNYDEVDKIPSNFLEKTAPTPFIAIENPLEKLRRVPQAARSRNTAGA